MSTMASNANYRVFFSGSLINLPKLSFGDVSSIVQRECVTKGSKLDRGYKLFHEQFIFSYEGYYEVSVIN